MARIYTTHTTESRELTAIACDICGESLEYEPTLYTRHEVRIIEYESYPEGGFKYENVVDLCPGCFTDKLSPWLREQGAEFHQVQSEW